MLYLSILANDMYIESCRTYTVLLQFFGTNKSLRVEYYRKPVVASYLILLLNSPSGPMLYILIYCHDYLSGPKTFILLHCTHVLHGLIWLRSCWYQASHNICSRPTFCFIILYLSSSLQKQTNTTLVSHNPCFQKRSFSGSMCFNLNRQWWSEKSQWCSLRHIIIMTVMLGKYWTICMARVSAGAHRSI